MNRIEELRKARHMTQYEFAEFCGLSRSSIARYEAGTALNLENAERIANACGVSMDYLLRRDVQEDDRMELLERIREDRDFRLLYAAAMKASPEHIRAATAMLNALKPEDFPE